MSGVNQSLPSNIEEIHFYYRMYGRDGGHKIAYTLTLESTLTSSGVKTHSSFQRSLSRCNDTVKYSGCVNKYKPLCKPLTSYHRSCFIKLSCNQFNCISHLKSNCKQNVNLGYNMVRQIMYLVKRGHIKRIFYYYSCNIGLLR